LFPSHSSILVSFGHSSLLDTSLSICLARSLQFHDEQLGAFIADRLRGDDGDETAEGEAVAEGDPIPIGDGDLVDGELIDGDLVDADPVDMDLED
jgi:hypothetical protein